MTISIQTLKKTFVGGILALLMFVAYAPQTHATSLPYYPVYQVQNMQELLVYLNSLIAQLNALQEQQRNLYGNTTYNSGGGFYTSRKYNYDVEVETNKARSIDEESATLYGEVDLDDASYAYVWFEYGQKGRFNYETDDERIDEYDSETFSENIDNLDEDEKYYFRAVAEDPSGHRVYGDIQSFITDDNGGSSSSSDDDEPDVETDDVEDVDEDSARINGEVDMNDFDDGTAFFVYGEDEDAVDDADREDEYRDIDEDGDDLRKYKIYTNLDGKRSFWLEIHGLDDDTDYYYRMCVEYDDEDNDPAIICGDTENFETDED